MHEVRETGGEHEHSERFLKVIFVSIFYVSFCEHTGTNFSKTFKPIKMHVDLW